MDVDGDARAADHRTIVRAFKTLVMIGALGVSTPARGAAPPPAPVARASDSSPSDAAPGDPVERRLDRGRKLLIAGAVTAGVGLVSAAIGVATLGGMQAANPGEGLSLEGSDRDHARRTLRMARGMEAFAYSGAALAVTGAIVATIGGVNYRKALRAREARRFTVAPGLGSLTLFGRF